MKMSSELIAERLGALDPVVETLEDPLVVDRVLLARVLAQPRRSAIPELLAARPGRRRVTLSAVAVVSLVTLLILLLVISPGSKVPTASAMNWRVISLNNAPFRNVGSGNEERLQCVTNKVCYSLGYASAPTASTIYRTVDGGRHWAPLAPLPVGSAELTPGVRCTGPQLCFYVTSDEIVLTDTGGVNWTTIDAPAGTQMRGAWCADAQRCLISEGTLGVGGTTTAFAVTSDGGRQWSTQPAPSVAGDSWYFTCDTSGRCINVLLGTSSRTLTALSYSTWGGPWTAQPSQSIDQSALLLTSCADASHCMFVGVYGAGKYQIISTSNAGLSWQLSGPPPGWLNIPTAVGCAAVDHCWVAMARYDTSNPDGTYSHPVIESTSNLGHTWTSVSVENTTPPIADVLALGCPPSGDGCLAIGNGQDHFVHPRGARSLSSPIILSNLPS